MLPEFVEEREELIRQRLRRLDFEPAKGNAPAVAMSVGGMVGN